MQAKSTLISRLQGGALFAGVCFAWMIMPAYAQAPAVPPMAAPSQAALAAPAVVPPQAAVPEAQISTPPAAIADAPEAAKIIANEKSPPSVPGMTAQSTAVPGPTRSLVLTDEEQAAIQQAKGYRGLVRPPTEGELDDAGGAVEKPKPPPEQRDVSLGGIVYVSPKDWTIWLNGQRITPGAIPKEAMDLKVREHYIEVKWFDEYTNQIFPLRLRPYQRFNIDTRIFLPG